MVDRVRSIVKKHAWLRNVTILEILSLEWLEAKTGQLSTLCAVYLKSRAAPNIRSDFRHTSIKSSQYSRPLIPLADIACGSYESKIASKLRHGTLKLATQDGYLHDVHAAAIYSEIRAYVSWRCPILIPF